MCNFNQFFFVCCRIFNLICNQTTLKNFILPINADSIDHLVDLPTTTFRNVDLAFSTGISTRKLKKIQNLFASCISFVENLIIRQVDLKTYNPLDDKCLMLSSLTLKNCKFLNFKTPNLPLIETLKFISLNSCDDGVYKLLTNQKNIEKIEIESNMWTWNGFPHDTFNNILKNSNVNEIKFVGAGTGSYFDSEDFPYQIQKLDTTMITFHWYVGIRNGRVSFLKSQLGCLKDLTIHELPNDFDGGDVLNYIFHNMNLVNFYYGETALICDGVRQEVKSFRMTELKIESAFELVRQFPSIESITLELLNTDIASDRVEIAINPTTDLFNNITEFELIDNSKYRGLFGVFLGLMKNLRNVRKLILKTPDRNINTLLEEFLPHMHQLTELYVTSTAPREIERLQIIKSRVINLRTISLHPTYCVEARAIFGNEVNVMEI